MPQATVFLATSLMGYGVSVGTAFTFAAGAVAVAKVALINLALGSVRFTDHSGTWIAEGADDAH